MSGNPFGVRRATEEDRDALCDFALLALMETSLLEPSKDKVKTLVDRCIRQEGAIAGVIESFELEWRIDASIGLIWTESLVSDEPYVEAVWCGLHPDARRIPYTKDGKRPDNDSPRAHYGRRLFGFAKWFQSTMSGIAERPVLARFDLTTVTDLNSKRGLYDRNLVVIGATYAVPPEKAVA